MKILAGLLLFVLLGIGANAQQSPQATKIFAETAAMSEKIVKGSPFSADAVNESVQVLADGNRIVRNSSNKLYRNSEGRFRRDVSGSSGGALASFYSVGPGVTILDPVQGYRYLLDSDLKTARVRTLGSHGGVSVALPAAPPAPPAVPTAERSLAAEKAIAEYRAARPAAVISPRENTYSGVMTAVARGGTFVYGSAAPSKYETRTEELGVQNIEGVEATGTRTITTIPAGDIGNERPIEIVYEKWYSNELQLVVMSKNSDPRFGEQTYRLTNIVRSEPDPSLFELPQGYRVLSEQGGGFTISTEKGKGQNVVFSRSGSGGATIVKTSKP